MKNGERQLTRRKKLGAILTDLSKAFDSLDHKLLIEKLSAYGFGKISLELIYSYISSRKQRVKINNCFSNWGNISSGVPQGSILGPLLFNIFIYDIFLFVTEIDNANYADDNTPYATDKCIELLLQKLERETSILNEWFAFNHLKSNNDKNKLLVTHGNTVSVKIGNEVIKSDTSVKLLGITIDNKLSFQEHVRKMCRKISQKIHALGRISKYVNLRNEKVWESGNLRTVMYRTETVTY